MREISFDGSPLQSGTSRGSFALTNERAHYSISGMREMVITARYYIDAPQNRSKRFVEYTCRDLHTSELYPGCRQLSAMGGVDDGDDNTLRPATNLLPGATGVSGSGSIVNEQTPAAVVDGDQVLVGFIDGSRSRPVIMGVFRHSGSNTYGATTAEGERRLTQHKGTSLELKSDGTYVITAKGGSVIMLDTDGNVTVDAKGGATVNLSDGSALTAQMGVVNGLAVDTFTGATQFALGNSSGTVLAKK